MLEAAQEALGFARGRSRADLDRDRMLVMALLKEVEVIGEAAARISEGTRAQHAGIPWPKIVGMRHRLVHVYFDVDLDRVWDTVSEDLPALVALLRPVIEDVPEGQ